MAMSKEAPKSAGKNSMIKVLCPKNGNQPTWANVGPKNGSTCTKCGGKGHEKAI